MAMKHFFVGVKALIRKDDYILLARGPIGGSHDFWDCPGGRIDDDESIAQTLERELKEELPNLTSYRVGHLLHAYRVHKDISGIISLTLLFYEVTEPVFAGDPKVSEEHEELRWFTLEEARRNGVGSIQEALAML